MKQMKTDKLSIRIDTISKYRAELMGIAMLNVLILHSISWSHAEPTLWITALKSFGRMVFTEGFLFLSGFGLYYSFHNDSRLRLFYVKRVKRLLIPYVIITLPFFLYHFFVGDFGFGVLFLKLSTLYFWFYGNDGMWYISISALFYTIYPYLHRVLGRPGGGYFLLIVSILFVASVYYFASGYYKMTYIGIAKIPFFILGMYVGKCSLEKKSISVYWIVAALVILGLLYMLNFNHIESVREPMYRIVGFSLCTFALTQLDRFNGLMILLRWFGTYSLEIYILHMLLAVILLKSGLNPLLAVTLIIALSLALAIPAKKYTRI